MAVDIINIIKFNLVHTINQKYDSFFA